MNRIQVNLLDTKEFTENPLTQKDPYADKIDPIDYTTVF